MMQLDEYGPRSIESNLAQFTFLMGLPQITHIDFRTPPPVDDFQTGEVFAWSGSMGKVYFYGRCKFLPETPAGMRREAVTRAILFDIMASQLPWGKFLYQARALFYRHPDAPSLKHAVWLDTVDRLKYRLMFWRRK